MTTKINTVLDLKPVLDAKQMRPGTVRLSPIAFHCMRAPSKVLLYYVVDRDLYCELLGQRWIMDVYQPVLEHDQMLLSHMGKMLGIPLISDGTLQLEQRQLLGLPAKTILAVYDDGHKLTAEGLNVHN